MFGKRNASQEPAGGEQPTPFLTAFRAPDGGMAVNIVPSGLGTPAHAGIILVDLMRHFARALAQTGAAKSEAEATATMLNLFQAELDHPTDHGSGSIVN